MSLVTAPVTWKQWFDLRWLDLRFFLVDAYDTPWWHGLVALGLLALVAGTALWLAGCVRVAWVGRRLAAFTLAAGGLALSICAVAVPIAWAFYSVPVAHRVLGITIFTPWLYNLPDNAVGWVPLGVALGVMGLGLVAIRRPLTDETGRTRT